MRAALQRVRLDKESTTNISKSSGIPTRTLRRYVNYSKDPTSIFYIEEEAEEECDDDVIVWKPQTAVPMFKIFGEADAVDAIVSDAVPTVDVVDTTPRGSCDDIKFFTADDVSIAGTDVGDFVDFDDISDDLSGAQFSAKDVFDNQEFDQLFQDFLKDDMFADTV